MIAGLDHGLPADIGEVSAEWMTAVLRTSGAIDVNTSVSSLQSEPFAVGVGLLSELYRSTLTYGTGSTGSAGGPETVIVKFPTNIEHQRAIADAFNIYAREVKAYTEVVPRSPIKAPVAYAAMIADDASNCCIVMEDLSGLTQVPSNQSLSWDQAVTAVESLAAFHATWLGSPELEAMSETFITFQNPVHLAALPGVHAAGWPKAKQHAAAILTPEVIGFVDDWVDHLPRMLDLMSESAGITHGDWRSDNMFFDDDGDVVVFDFQVAGVGNGAYDLAYFISQSLEREQRQGRERELVELYIAAMAAHGCERDVEQMWFEVRCAAAFCIMYGYASYPQYEDLPVTSKAMTEQLLRRSVETIVDLDAVGAIDELAARA